MRLIKIIKKPVSLKEVREIAKETHGDMVKGAADVERNIIALGGEWHIDANNELLADGSQQNNIWGFNIYPYEKKDFALEYISLINIRPSQGSREMEIKDEKIREQIKSIIKQLIPELYD